MGKSNDIPSSPSKTTKLPPNGPESSQNGDITVNKEAKGSVQDILNETLLEKVRTAVETIRTETKADIEQRLDIMADRLVDEVRRISCANREFAAVFQNNSARDSKSKRSTHRGTGDKKPRLPEKVFQARNSLLTDLFGVPHIRTIYHIFVVCMLLTFLNTVVHDLAVDGSINLGLRPFRLAFGNFHVALLIWLGMQTLSTCVYFAFKFWANMRIQLSKYNGLVRIWDTGCILAFAAYQIAFFYMVTKLVLYCSLPHASSVAVLMEMTRFVMKTYAFVRSNAPKVHHFKEKSDDEKLLVKLPTHGWYQYFLFCPTLVYRDAYPRTNHIRWKKVVTYFAELLMVIMFLSFIFERFALPYFGTFGDAEATTTVGQLVMSIFGCIMPGITIFMCGFYSFLHVWLNMWAEMLRFADRMFYSDWWTATSFDVYYRKWNVVVHDFLYNYVYKDLYEKVFVGRKVAAAISVFTISAVIHEYIIAFAFRFFYPVLFVLFEGFGVIMMFVPIRQWNSVGNIILWAELCLGNGLQLALYTIEHFARKNCDVGEELVDYLVPVSWSCHNVTINPDWQIKLPF